MICNCHHEAAKRNDDRIMVNRVALHRVHSPRYPRSTCGVIYQPSQFSWTLSKSLKRKVISGYSYQVCYDAAVAAKRLGASAADHYHASYVSPDWRKRCRRIFNIGVHIYYNCYGGKGSGKSSPTAR